MTWVQRLGTSEADAARAELAAWYAEQHDAHESGELDATGREALLWAGAILYGADARWTPELRVLIERVSRDASPTRMLHGIGSVATHAFQCGRPDLAERATDLGIIAGDVVPGQAWTVVPYLWFLRSEIARKTGRWDEVEICLERLRASLHDDADLAGYPDLLAGNRDYRARYHLGRARMLLEQGVVEGAQAELRTGEEVAKLCGWVATRVYAAMVALEVAMMTRSFAVVIEASQRLQKEPWFDTVAQQDWMVFRAIEGTCWAELERLWLLGIEPAQGSLALADSRARELLTEALDAGVLGVPDRVKVHTLLADGALLRGEPEVALEHLTTCDELGAAVAASALRLRDDALVAALRWRALSRLAAGDEPRPYAETTAAYDALCRAFDRLLAQWGSVAPRPGGVGFLHLEWRTFVLETLIDATREMHPDDRPDERAFEHVLAAQAMGSVARERGVPAPSIDEVMDTLLAKDRVLVVLSPGRTGSHVFLLQDGRVECHPAAPYEKMKQLAEPVMTALRSPGNRPVDPAAWSALRDGVLPPAVAARIAAADSVYTHGFHSVNELSLACLPVKGERLLAETHAVAALASLPLAVARARAAQERTPESSPARDALFVIAPGDQGLDVDDLPFGRDERDALTGAFDADRVDVLTHAGATAQALLEPGRLDGVGVLFVLAHTVPDDAHEGSAKLVLAHAGGEGPAYVDVAALRALRFDGVVVLASCSAASAPVRIGDDALAHLGGAFLEGGALAVVIARQRVEYRRTLALFETALERLAAGAPTAEAVRAGYAATLGDERASAFAAAGFQVLGLGLEPALLRTPR